eukprot:3538998-Rhodomonas_salina.1
MASRVSYALQGLSDTCFLCDVCWLRISFGKDHHCNTTTGLSPQASQRCPQAGCPAGQRREPHSGCQAPNRSRRPRLDFEIPFPAPASLRSSGSESAWSTGSGNLRGLKARRDAD